MIYLETKLNETGLGIFYYYKHDKKEWVLVCQVNSFVSEIGLNKPIRID